MCIRDTEVLKNVAMQQPFDKFLMFKNRLVKVYRHVHKQAVRQKVSCYRIYDHDIPEFPFIIERYEDKLYVAEYKRRHSLSEEDYLDWKEKCIALISEILEVPEGDIFTKLRQKKAGRLGQYQKNETDTQEFIAQENGLNFLINLNTYIDTGLFLDHRITRQMVREMASKKRVLNLFCYTGSFSVYAVAGHCTQIVSVDLSKTYLSWAARNLKLNFPEFKQHDEVHKDVKAYLKKVSPGSFEMIIMDPPTFSNSKRMDDVLDIQRDHIELINNCIEILSPGGVLIFSTNLKKFNLDQPKINATQIKDITRFTTSFDFKDKLQRQCFMIHK
ncbi:MAG: class I SAM-dependent methyltransferase [Flavisolibacter sp.]